MNVQLAEAEIEKMTCEERMKLLQVVHRVIGHKCITCDDRKQLACQIYNPVNRAGCGVLTEEKTNHEK